MTIELKDLLFFGYHGLYAEERKAGNEYKVDISITYNTDATVLNSIKETINYASVYVLVKEQMKQPKDLLETVTMTIAEKIYASYPQVKKIEISLYKLQPPIVQFRGRVGVTYVKEF